MRLPSPGIFLLASTLALASCSTRTPLPKYEKPIARTAVQHVRTTAYTDTESDHLKYSNHNALGGILRSGPIHSAAADWSRWPAGSLFRIRETGEIFEVDDYGWALAGTNTIDLYKPSRAAMNAWGVRRVTIENLRWGDPAHSRSILRGRSGYAHVRRMLEGLDEYFAGRSEAPATVPETLFVSAPAAALAVPIAIATPVPRAAPVERTTYAQAPRATRVNRPASGPTNGVANDPFFANTAR